jgi:putative copper export protein/mono/diheme cytochrome c family protein/peroxiredoxin
MSALHLAVAWFHLAACVVLTGTFSLLLMAGDPTAPAMRRWEAQVLAAARWLVIAAIASGLLWLTIRTALFEGRAKAAIDPSALLRSMLDTWPGNIWMMRHGLLLVLAAFLWLDRTPLRAGDRLAARLEAFLLSASALVLLGASGHAAAISSDRWPSLVDMIHLLGAGIWIGGLPWLVLLLRAASHGDATVDAYAITTMRRFSQVALVTVLVLAATGTITGSLLVEGLPGLVGTAHGRLLLLKIGLLLPVLLLAAASRALLPKLSGPPSLKPGSLGRRMALFIALEAALVLLVLGVAAAMTINTPARHTDPVWPWPLRLPLEAFALPWPVWGIALTAGLGVLLLVAIILAWKRRWALAALLTVLVTSGAGLGLSSSTLEAFPTSYRRSPIAYAAASIAQGASLHDAHCSSCHEGPTAGRTGRRTAGELYWLTTHGRPGTTMPAFADVLDDSQRWHLVNYLRAVETASTASRIGPTVDLDNPWLVAPNFSISVGALAPTALHDFRGRRMVLLVLYSLPASRERMSELARQYGALSVLGVEVIAVAPRSSPGAIAALDTKPAPHFPIVTAGNEDIDRAYRVWSPGSAHAEFLIDRQGYVRAIWQSDRTGMPSAAAVQAEVERLNEEKAPPPLPDDHLH